MYITEISEKDFLRLDISFRELHQKRVPVGDGTGWKLESEERIIKPKDIIQNAKEFLGELGIEEKTIALFVHKEDKEDWFYFYKYYCIDKCDYLAFPGVSKIYQDKNYYKPRARLVDVCNVRKKETERAYLIHIESEIAYNVKSLAYNRVVEECERKSHFYSIITDRKNTIVEIVFFKDMGDLLGKIKEIEAKYDKKGKEDKTIYSVSSRHENGGFLVSVGDIGKEIRK